MKLTQRSRKLRNSFTDLGSGGKLMDRTKNMLFQPKARRSSNYEKGPAPSLDLRDRVTAHDFTFVDKYMAIHPPNGIVELLEKLLWSEFSAEQMLLLVDCILFSVGHVYSSERFLTVCLEFYIDSFDDDHWVAVHVHDDLTCDSKRSFIAFMVLRWLKEWDGMHSLDSHQDLVFRFLKLIERDAGLDLEICLNEQDEEEDESQHNLHRDPALSYGTEDSPLSPEVDEDVLSGFNERSTYNPQLFRKTKRKEGLVKIAVELEDLLTFFRTSSMPPSRSTNSTWSPFSREGELEDDDDGILWFLDHETAKEQGSQGELYEYPSVSSFTTSSEGSGNRPRSLSLCYRKKANGSSRSSDLGHTSWASKMYCKGTAKQSCRPPQSEEEGEEESDDASSIHSEESNSDVLLSSFSSCSSSNGPNPVFETGKGGSILDGRDKFVTDLSRTSFGSFGKRAPMPPHAMSSRNSFSTGSKTGHRRSASSSLGLNFQKNASAPTLPARQSEISEISKASSKLLEYSPEYVAKQFTLYLHEKIYSKMTLLELSKLAREKGYGPNIQRMIRVFEVISSWVETEVLAHSRRSASSRIRVLVYFVRLASACRDLKSYHLLFALVAGLGQPTLTWVWALAQTKDLQQFKDLQRAVSPKNNYLVYRADLSKCGTTAVKMPFLGVFLKDMAILGKALEGSSKDSDQLQDKVLGASWKCFSYACGFLGGVRVQETLDEIPDPQVHYLLSMSLQHACTDPAVKINMSLASKQKFYKSKRERMIFFFKNRSRTASVASNGSLKL